jgi:hypothetical protein
MNRRIGIVYLSLLIAFAFSAAEAATGDVYALTLSVETVTTRHKADGTLHRTRHVERTFRSVDGRTRIEKGKSILLRDPGRNQIIILNRDARTATILNRDKAQAFNGNRAAGPLPLDKVSEESLGERVAGGFLCVGTRMKLRLPRQVSSDGEYIIREVWRSRQLGVPMLTIVEDGRNRDITVQTSRLLSNEEVSSSLFEVPADYSTSTRR